MAAVSDENRPADLNTRRAGPGLDVDKDKLIIKYTGAGRHQNDVASIQSNKPAPLECRVCYFEVAVLDGGDHSRIGVGFGSQDFPTNKQPGWDNASYGYHGEDGQKFHGGGGQPFSEKFSKGAVIGAGYHLQRQEIFFTKNGKKLGVAFRGVTGLMYPTVGLHSRNACVQVNFGSAAFVFDVEGMLAEEKEQEMAAARSMPLPAAVPHDLVLEYLLHYGYSGTLQAFQEAAGTAPSTSRGSSWEVTSLPLRQQVRQRVVAGDSEAALRLVAQHHPSLLEGAGGEYEVAFHLYCQQYIDMVRSGRVEEAVAMAQKLLWPLRSPSHPHRDPILRDVMALVAYRDPGASPLAHLLSLAQRERVADVANTAILSLDPTPRSAASIKSGVEKVLQQLAAVHGGLREVGGNQGEVFQLEQHLCSGTQKAAAKQL